MAALPSVRFLVALIGALVCGLVLAACGGGGGEEQQVDLTSGQITDAELVLMLLPKAEMGEEYAGLSFARDPWLWTASDITSGALDPEEQAEDLEQFPLVSGSHVVYAESAIDGETGEPTDRTVAFTVYLFEDPQAASGYLEDELADWESQVGTMRTGLRHFEQELTAAERFKPGGIADESRGIRLTLASFINPPSAIDVHLTTVWFRRGRLLASTSMSTTLGDPDFREAAEALARKLDERIQAVLRGELTPTPVGVP
jgi:hypothetical protein